MNKVNIEEKFSLFDGYYEPKIVGELNGQYVKLVKFKDAFVWHHHKVEDEMFLLLEGEMTMELRDGNVDMKAGEFIIVPHGIEHKPVAKGVAKVMLFEPNTTLNTGNVDCDITQTELETL